MNETPLIPRDVLTAAAKHLRDDYGYGVSAAKLDAWRDAHYPAQKVRGKMTRDSVWVEWRGDGTVLATAPTGALFWLSRSALSDLAAYDATVDADGYVIAQGSGVGVSAAASDPVLCDTGESSAAAPSSVPAPAPREWWVNFYGVAYSVHATRADADDVATSRRTECVHVREVTPDEEEGRDWRSIARAYLEERNDARASLAWVRHQRTIATDNCDAMVAELAALKARSTDGPGSVSHRFAKLLAALEQFFPTPASESIRSDVLPETRYLAAIAGAVNDIADLRERLADIARAAR